MIQQNSVSDHVRGNAVGVAVCFALICLLGIFLRVANLGGPDLGIDESYHVYASKELMKGNPPQLPGGSVYSRGLVFSWLVALVGKIGGLNEWTARIPGVIFGVLTVVIVFLISRHWYSNGVGLVAAFLVAVIPVEIAMSRYVRMYTMFQFFYLLTLFLFFHGFESFGVKKRIGKTSDVHFKVWDTLEIKPIFLIIAGLLFLFTTQVHSLIIPAMAGPLLYIVFMGFVSWWLPEISFGCKTKYVVGVFLIGMTAFGIYIFNEELYARYWNYAIWLPDWAQNENVDNWRYYRDTLALRYPAIFATFLFGSFLGLAKAPKPTIYLTICFFAPIILASLVFPLKSFRYIFHLLPLMFILFSLGFVDLLSYLFRLLVQVGERELPPAIARFLSFGILLGGILFFLGSTHWFAAGIRYYTLNVSRTAGISHNNWNETMQFISKNRSQRDILITPWPLLSKYYGGDMTTYYYNPHNPSKFNREPLADALPIEDLNGFKKVVEENPSGWIVFERYRYFDLPGAVPAELQQWIEANLELVQIPTAQDMLIWKW